jgi:hypothetical protein
LAKQRIRRDNALVRGLEDLMKGAFT